MIAKDYAPLIELSEWQWVSVQDVKDKIGLTDSQIRHAIRKMTQNGAVDCEVIKENNQYTKYRAIRPTDACFISLAKIRKQQGMLYAPESHKWRAA